MFTHKTTQPNATAFKQATRAAVFAMLSVVAPVTAHAAEDAGRADAETPELPRTFIGVTVGGQLNDFSAARTKGGFLYGASLQIGGYLSTDRAFLKDLLLTADIGLYTGDWTDTLLDERGPYTGPPMPGWDIERSTLSRKSEHINVPMLLTLAYDIPLGESFSLRIGPTLGLTYVSMKSKFDSRDEVYNTTGDLMNGTSTTLNRSGSKAVLSYGLTLGARWAFTENLSADLQYRFQGTEKLNLGTSRNYGTSTTHQFNAGINYSF